MYAWHPRNLARAPFIRDVMRERSECPMIGNSYLLSDALPKNCKKRRQRVIDQYMHSPTCLQLLAASFCNVCFVQVHYDRYNSRGRILCNRTRDRTFPTAKYLVGMRSALSVVWDDYIRI